MRDLAFPLIEPPYDRVSAGTPWSTNTAPSNRSSANCGRSIRPPTTGICKANCCRSTAARYNQLIDDIRNDIVRIEPFFMAARRVVDLDRRREASMAQIADLTPAERVNAQARIGENSLTIAWVGNSLDQRCASYRFALEHLAVAEPEPVAAEADRVLTELQQLIEANQVVVACAATRRRAGRDTTLAR